MSLRSFRFAREESAHQGHRNREDLTGQPHVARVRGMVEPSENHGGAMSVGRRDKIWLPAMTELMARLVPAPLSPQRSLRLRHRETPTHPN